MPTLHHDLWAPMLSLTSSSNPHRTPALSTLAPRLFLRHQDVPTSGPLHFPSNIIPPPECHRTNTSEEGSDCLFFGPLKKLATISSNCTCFFCNGKVPESSFKTQAREGQRAGFNTLLNSSEKGLWFLQHRLQALQAPYSGFAEGTHHGGPSHAHPPHPHCFSTIPLS